MMVHKPQFPAPVFRGLFANIPLSSDWSARAKGVTSNAGDGSSVPLVGNFMHFAECDRPNSR
jgi:hypothetical protein